MGYWKTEESSLSLAIQSDLTTENETPGDFTALRCEKPDISFATEVTEIDTLTGQAGAASEKIIGGKSGTITFNVPLEGLAGDYNPTADNLDDAGVMSPVFPMLANAMGSQTAAITGADINAKNANFWKGENLYIKPYSANLLGAGSTTTAITTDAGGEANYDAGMFTVHGTDANETEAQTGWLKTTAAETLNLFSAAQNAAATNDSRFGSGTCWTSSDAPYPFSMRYVGSETEFGYVLIGCICSGFTISLNSKEVPMVSFTYEFIDWYADKTIGALVVPTAYTRTPRIVGNKAGRIVLDGVKTCGLEDMSLEFTAELQDIACHSAAEGIDERLVKDRTTKLSFSIPHTSTDVIYDSAGLSATAGTHKLQYYFEEQEDLSVQIEVGNKPGQYFSVLIPAGKITEAPGMSDRDGFNAYSVAMEAGAYTGDTGSSSSTTPTDSAARLGLG